MKKLTNDLIIKIKRTESTLVDVSVKWDEVWDTEEELIFDMLRVCAGDSLPLSVQVKGYKYIESFKNYYMLNGFLTPKQMGVLKRNLAPKIAYTLYAKNCFVKDEKPMVFEEEGLVFKPISYNISTKGFIREFREYLQENFGKYCNEVEYVILSDDGNKFSLDLGIMTYNYPTEPDDFEFAKTIEFDKKTLKCLSKDVKDSVGSKISLFVYQLLDALKVIGPVDILCLDYSPSNRHAISGICCNKEKKDFFDQEWKLSNYVAYVRVV